MTERSDFLANDKSELITDVAMAHTAEIAGSLGQTALDLPPKEEHFSDPIIPGPENFL